MCEGLDLVMLSTCGALVVVALSAMVASEVMVIVSLCSASVAEEGFEKLSDGLTNNRQRQTFFLSSDDFTVNGMTCYNT